MKTGDLEIKEIFLDCSARIVCARELIPLPGQYLLASRSEDDSPLAVPIFPAESTPDGFYAAPVLSSTWQPGARLRARGPIGHGFRIPPAARKVALIAYDDAPYRLRGLISLAFQQSAEVVLLANSPAPNLPESVEVQPLQAWSEIVRWADFIAADAQRENWAQFKTMMSGYKLPETQILIRAPMPCGGLAECGACALPAGHWWKMICKDGPVFRWDEIV